MDILLYKDLICNFLNQTIDNKEHLLQIKKILENENSIFLYSKKFFQFIKDELGDDYLEDYQSFVKKIADLENSVCLVASEISMTFDEEFIRVYTLSKANIVLNICYEDPSDIVLNTVSNNVAVLSKQTKPNAHWLLVQLAIAHPNTITVRQHDFSSDIEVDAFFYQLFSIPKKLNTVAIFDDHCNFKHQKFAYLTSKKTKGLYNTAILAPSDNDSRYKAMKLILPGFLLFGKKGGCHEREIIFEGFIVNPTHDFFMLTVTDAKKWSIHLQYAPIEAKKSLAYSSAYKRYNNGKWLEPEKPKT